MATGVEVSHAHLVGSVGLDSVEEVMATVGRLLRPPSETDARRGARRPAALDQLAMPVAAKLRLPRPGRRARRADPGRLRPSDLGRRRVETVVPGHGPIADKEGIRGLRDYLRFVEAEARQRYDAGMGYEEAGRDIELGPYANWIDRERIVLNVFACYREFGATADPDRFAALSEAARYYFDEHAGRMQPREARADRENGR